MKTVGQFSHSLCLCSLSHTHTQYTYTYTYTYTIHMHVYAYELLACYLSLSSFKFTIKVLTVLKESFSFVHATPDSGFLLWGLKSPGITETITARISPEGESLKTERDKASVNGQRSDTVLIQATNSQQSPRLARLCPPH